MVVEEAGEVEVALMEVMTVVDMVETDLTEKEVSVIFYKQLQYLVQTHPIIKVTQHLTELNLLSFIFFCRLVELSERKLLTKVLF